MEGVLEGVIVGVSLGAIVSETVGLFVNKSKIAVKSHVALFP